MRPVLRAVAHCNHAGTEVCSTLRVIWDVLVVGGGVVGWSVAHHLAAAGVRRILVVDRGGGSTERATGGFRAQFATETNVRLSLLSREKLLAFGDETGVDPGFRPAGYLFLAA